MRLKPQTYAITAIAHERRRIFQRATNAELLIATILRYRDGGRFLLHGLVVMPDHLHVLLSPSESIEKTAQLIKGGFSFAVRKQHGRNLAARLLRSPRDRRRRLCSATWVYCE